MRTYQVKHLTSFSEIAKATGVSAEELKKENPSLSSQKELLSPGQTLLLPPPKRMHTVKAGEEIDQLCRTFGITPRMLLRMNQSLSLGHRVRPGEKITVWEACEERAPLMLNGYADPHISGSSLSFALPFLTFLTVKGGGVEGEKIGTPHVRQMLRMAREAGVLPLLSLKPSTSLQAPRDDQLQRLKRDYAGVILSLGGFSEHIVTRTAHIWGERIRACDLLTYLSLSSEQVLATPALVPALSEVCDGIFLQTGSPLRLCSVTEELSDCFPKRARRSLFPILCQDEKHRVGKRRGVNEVSYQRSHRMGGDALRSLDFLERVAHSRFGGIGISVSDAPPELYRMLNRLFALQEAPQTVPPHCGQ